MTEAGQWHFTPRVLTEIQAKVTVHWTSGLVEGKLRMVLFKLKAEESLLEN